VKFTQTAIMRLHQLGNVKFALKIEKFQKKIAKNEHRSFPLLPVHQKSTKNQQKTSEIFADFSADVAVRSANASTASGRE
jgi:hypothetical protein